MVSESTLTLDILPLSADTARLVRVYGTEPCIALPGTLPAPEGGQLCCYRTGRLLLFRKAAQPACGRQDLPLRGGPGRHGAADSGLWADGGRHLPSV